MKKIKCHNQSFCPNDAVGEADLADGRGVQFYCRRCMIEYGDFDLDNTEVDDSLVFCQREWNAQEPAKETSHS